VFKLEVAIVIHLVTLVTNRIMDYIILQWTKRFTLWSKRKVGLILLFLVVMRH